MKTTGVAVTGPDLAVRAAVAWHSGGCGMWKNSMGMSARPIGMNENASNQTSYGQCNPPCDSAMTDPPSLGVCSTMGLGSRERITLSIRGRKGMLVRLVRYVSRKGYVPRNMMEGTTC